MYGVVVESCSGVGGGGEGVGVSELIAVSLFLTLIVVRKGKGNDDETTPLHAKATSNEQKGVRMGSTGVRCLLAAYQA